MLHWCSRQTAELWKFYHSLCWWSAFVQGDQLPRWLYYGTKWYKYALNSNWVDKNKLTLIGNKCKCMIISRLKAELSDSSYSDKPIEPVSSYKYLGVIITNDLSWSTHIEQITSKMIGLIYYQFYTWSSQSGLLLDQLYSSLVRPRLEYATQTSKDIQNL